MSLRFLNFPVLQSELLAPLVLVPSLGLGWGKVSEGPRPQNLGRPLFSHRHMVVDI